MLFTQTHETLSKISYVERKIDERRKSITIMERKIQECLAEIERKRQLVTKIKFQKSKIDNRLYTYRKVIRQSIKDDRSLVDYTNFVFNRQDQTLNDLDTEIVRSTEKLGDLQEYAASVKKMVKIIQIPEFKDDLLMFNFNECLMVDHKLLGAIQNMEFSKDDIEEKKKKKEKLIADVKLLKPPTPNLVANNRPRLSQIKRKPSREMDGAKNYDSVFILKSLRKARVVLKKHSSDFQITQFTQIDNKISHDKSSLTDLLKKVKKISLLSNEKKTFLNIDSKKNCQLMSEKVEKLRNLKKKIEKEKAQIKEIRMEIPEQWNGSAQGLLRWREQLLKRRETQKVLLANIQKEQMQLKDRSIITKTRIRALSKDKTMFVPFDLL